MRMIFGRGGHCHTILPLSILILGLALRVFHLTHNSLWVDEGFSVSVASHGIRDIIAGTAADQHPPFYYLLLHYWMLLGRSVFNIRLLSVLCGTACIAVIYELARRLYGPGLAVTTAFLLAISPMHIWYSQEARMYVLLGLLTMFSVYLTWRLLEQPSRGIWLSYGLVTLAALYTHYFTLFILVFENAFALGSSFWRRQWHFLAKWLSAQAALFLGFLPWLPIFIFQVRYHNPAWIPRPDLASIRDTFLYLSLGTKWSAKGSVYIGALWLLLALGGLTFSLNRAEKRKETLFVVLWFLLPSVTIIGTSLHYPLYQDKQFLVVIAPLLLLFAVGANAAKVPLRAIIVISLIALLYSPLYDQYFMNQKQQWRDAACYIDTYAQPGDVIFLNAAAGALTLNYYLNSDLPQEGYPHNYDLYKGGFDGDIATADIVEERLSRLAQRYHRIWLVQYSAGFWDPRGLIPAWLDKHGTLVRAPGFFDIDVRLYQVGEGK